MISTAATASPNLASAREQHARRLVLRVTADAVGNGLLQNLKSALQASPKDLCPVVIDYQGANAGVELSLPDAYRLKPSDLAWKTWPRSWGATRWCSTMEARDASGCDLCRYPPGPRSATCGPAYRLARTPEPRRYCWRAAYGAALARLPIDNKPPV